MDTDSTLLNKEKNIDSTHATLIEKYKVLAETGLKEADYQRAEYWYGEILKIEPSHFQARIGLAEVAEGRGEQEKALILALELQDQGVEDERLLCLIGKIYRAKKEYTKSIDVLKKAFQLNPKNAVTVYQLGLTFLKINNPEIGSLFLEKAIQLDPKSLNYRFELGYAYFTIKNYTKAIESFQICSEQFPKHFQSLNALGSCYILNKQPEKAIDVLNRAIELNSRDRSCYYNLGLGYMELGQWQEAAEYAEKACHYGPQDAKAFYLAGNIFYKIGQLEKAQTYYDKALILDPEKVSFQFARSLLDLTKGDFEKGLEGYELRYIVHPDLMKIPEPLRQKPWQGQDLNNQRLLILPEQGLGDNIQMIRYVPMVKEKYPTCRIILEARPSLRKIYSETFEEEALLVSSGLEALNYDYSVSIASLPYWFKTKVETVPQKMPYIKVNSYSVQEWGQRIAQSGESKLKVGIAWAGNPANPNDWKRSLDITDIVPLLEVQGVVFYSLQIGDNSLKNLKKTSLDEYNKLNKHYPLESIVDFTDLMTDIHETAALIQNLDIVICACSLISHLSGALNQKTWVLLSYAADWRWLLSTNTSVWYPSAKLFRQPQLFNWKSVVDEVKQELGLTVKARKG